MKNITRNKKESNFCRNFNRKQWLFIFAVSLLSFQYSAAQVKVPFTQRTSTHTNGQKIYNIKGDFQMIGNTNLTLVDYGDNVYNTNMKYVDIDGDPNTLNSSSATLQFPTQDGGNTIVPECSNIIYAGLYWTGRAHDGASPNAWIQGGSNNDRNNNNTFNGYTLSIAAVDDYSQGGSDGRVATYTFTPTASGDVVVFRFYSWFSSGYKGMVTVQIGSGFPALVNGSLTSTGDNNYVFSFTTPFTINTGTQTIYINSLKKRRTSNSINTNCSANVTNGGKLLDKSVVRLKHATASGYTTISAEDANFTQNIYYGQAGTANGDCMYSAYADITQYVQDHGVGLYTVADIALSAGNGGNTGFYGGWGMIVIYENDQMKWRDVTIFDGHAYVAASGGVNNLPISGFRAAQSGPINLKLGVMAGEGDVRNEGDYLEIQKRNTANYQRLNHSMNTQNNFFNSSINTGGNYRNPSPLNNSGLDIAMFNIDNTGNSVIDNNQSSTEFRYGTNQDTYIIFCIAMAVDAYVPDVVASNTLVSVGGIPYTSSITSVLPSEVMEYTLDISNKGNENVKDLKIVIPVPFTSEYVSFPAATAQYFANNVSGTVTYNPSLGATGSIVWDIGDLPIADISVNGGIQATLTYSFRVTTDCSILSNASCVKMVVGGVSSGEGVHSGTKFSDRKFIWGYNTSGSCAGIPIYTPVSLNIDADAYREANCPSTGDPILKLYYCEINEDELPFSFVAGNFPTGSTFFSAIETYDDTDLGLTGLVRPTASATQYTTTTGFPNDVGTATYYAIAPATNTSCFWEFEVTVSVECYNLWHGTESTDWDTKGNWIYNRVPGTGEDIQFATDANNPTQTDVTNSGPAVRDLYVPANTEKIIGNLINLSDKATVIPANSGIIVNGTVTGSDSDPNKIKILADPNDGSDLANPTKPNGSFIVKNGCTTTIMGTVQMYAKADKNTIPRTWKDQIPGSPTYGTIFSNLVYQWQQFGIPVKQVQANPTFAGTYLNEYFENWNGDNTQFYQKWKYLDNNSILRAFGGYELAQDSKKMIAIQGELLLCDQEITLTREAPVITSYTGNLIENKRYGLGQNVFGNSFTAAIDVAAIDFKNISYNGVSVDNSNGDYVEKTVYVYNSGCFGAWGSSYDGTESNTNQCDPSNTNAGNYTTIPVNTASATFKKIPSMQGFLLKHVKDENISGNEGYGHDIKLKLTYSSLVKNDAPQRAPSAPLSYLKVSLVSSSTRDLLWLFSQDGTSDEFDNGWDGEKFFGTPTAFIYAPTPAGKMQVNTTDNIVGSYIDFVSNTEKTYTITLDKVNLDAQYPELYLVDLVTKEVVALNNETTSYTFTADNAGETSRRFRIKSEPFVSESDTRQIDAYSNGKGIVVVNNETENASFRLYDSLGKLIYTQNILPMSQQTISVNVVAGVYIANFVLGGDATSKKIVVTK